MFFAREEVEEGYTQGANTRCTGGNHVKQSSSERSVVYGRVHGPHENGRLKKADDDDDDCLTKNYVLTHTHIHLSLIHI